MILYSAPASYYSMIARLALNEANENFKTHYMDIHIAKEQLKPWYSAINPGMTVPALVDEQSKWTDSEAILQLAAQKAAENWSDADVALSPTIEKIVKAHYNLSIEQLTFGKAMLKHALLRKLFPHMLSKIIKQLESELQNATDKASVEHKIAVNQERLQYFTQGDLHQKLNERRSEVREYINQLPESQPLLFGQKISSADIVTAVLFARLKMIGEEDLINHPALVGWFKSMSSRPAFIKSDIWLKFKPWRILLKY